MRLPAVLLTNGRPSCVSKTIPSIREHLHGVDDLLVVDDSGDDVYRGWLTEQFGVSVVLVGEEPCGYWKAMRRVWDLCRDSAADVVAFWEEDFVLNVDVDAEELASVLDAHPHLTQMALLRQPWFHNEQEHGGLIPALEAQGQWFTEVTDGRHFWIEHRACFTGNPSLIPRRTFERDWPEGDWSESRFGRALFDADPAARGAYWGRRTDRPRVEHIGHERVGSGY